MTSGTRKATTSIGVEEEAEVPAEIVAEKPAATKAPSLDAEPDPSGAPGHETLGPEDVQEHLDRVLNIDKRLRGQKRWMYEMLHRYFDLQLVGAGNIDPQRPTLFVGNHCIWGIDGAMTPLAILNETGTLPRLLTDGRAMAGAMEDFMIEMGQVQADPRVCDGLMDAGESLMVFPGGAREGAKTRDELYKLLWEGRTGFVKVAVRHGYTITPFASVGPDEVWDIALDRGDIVGSRVDQLMEWLLPDWWEPEKFPPVPRGLGWTMLPRPERCYLSFGEPIDMAAFAGEEDNESVVTSIKDRVQVEVDGLIKEAMLLRARQRPTMSWLRRQLTRL